VGRRDVGLGTRKCVPILAKKREEAFDRENFLGKWRGAGKSRKCRPRKLKKKGKAILKQAEGDNMLGTKKKKEENGECSS